MREKTTFVWVMLFLVGLFILFSFLSLLSLLFKGLLGASLLFTIGSFISSIVWIFLWVVYFFKLKGVVSNIVWWTNFTFGVSLFVYLFSGILAVYSAVQALSGYGVFGTRVIVLMATIGSGIFILWLVLWRVFVRHLKKNYGA